MSALEQEVAQKAQIKLRQLVPDLRVLSEATEASVGDFRADLLLNVAFGTLTKTIVIETKSSGEPRYIFEAVAKLRYLADKIQNAYGIIALPKISERGKEICKTSGVGYLDLIGNIYVKFASVLIEKEERGRIERQPRYARDVFARLASRVVRILMVGKGEDQSQEEPKKWTVSELAKTAKVSLNLAYKVVRSLEVKGFVTRDYTRAVRVSNPRSLLDDWANAYSFSQNQVLPFYSEGNDAPSLINKVAETNGMRYALTLHSGASLVAPYVRYSDVHLYIDLKDKGAWVRTLDLRPVEFGGNAYLLVPYDEGIYYGLQEKQGANVVSNVQLYLDLFKYPARGREQADYLREQVLKF